jgi:hypothetical protein
MVDTRRCLLCGRRFNWQSTPRWAFDRDGRPAGIAHRTCARAHGDWGAYRFGDPADVPLAQAWARAWLRHFRPAPVSRSVEWWAGFLFELGQAAALNEAQRALLATWATWPHQVEPPAVVARYRQLGAEYAAWRGALDASPGE